MKLINRLFSICAILTISTYSISIMAMGKKPVNDNDENAPPMRVDKIYADLHCALPHPQTVWVESQKEYQALFGKLRQSHMDAQTINPPVVDWSHDAVILVGMGQKNTGGYLLDLASTHASVNKGILGIVVQWQEPKPGMIVTQALTSPCLLLKIPNSGYRRIEIKDQAGNIRMEVER